MANVSSSELITSMSLGLILIPLIETAELLEVVESTRSPSGLMSLKTSPAPWSHEIRKFLKS